MEREALLKSAPVEAEEHAQARHLVQLHPAQVLREAWGGAVWKVSFN